MSVCVLKSRLANRIRHESAANSLIRTHTCRRQSPDRLKKAMPHLLPRSIRRAPQRNRPGQNQDTSKLKPVELEWECRAVNKRANASYCIESHLSAMDGRMAYSVVERGVTAALARAQYPLIRLTVCVVMPLFQCFLCIAISVYPLVRFDNPVRERSPHELIQLTKGFREPEWKREPGFSLCSVSSVRHKPRRRDET
ncbi:hypothetical protein CBL_14020 [Carabus blaptoides fortunei]